ncbi:glycosyltransferase [Paenalcaligenes hominis]|uniref:glycosyltransferase n=1 Tax=Paenalcaligenes hominis TaxID=643674 RepID=UPI0035252ADC
MNKKIYIIVRYSVVSKSIQGGWRAGSKVNYIDYKNLILNEARLNARFNLFVNITIKSILSQKNFDYKNLKLVVLTSKDLPVSHKEKLKELENKYDWLFVSYLGDDCNIKDYSSFVKEDLMSLEKDSLYVTLRLDDDDALSDDFLYRVMSYMEESNKGFALSFNEGFSAKYDTNENDFIEFYPLRVMNLAIGLGFINYYNYEEKKFFKNHVSIYDLGNHSFIDRKVPVIVDGRRPAYIRTIYEGQDTLQQSLLKQVKDKKALDKKDVQPYFSFLNKK